MREDRDRIAAAAHELVDGRASYEDCLRDHFAALLAAHGGDRPRRSGRIDGVHRAYVGLTQSRERRRAQVPAAAGR